MLTPSMLWIAFKNLYLCDGEHPLRLQHLLMAGCELLSKICIFVTANIRCREVCVSLDSCELLSKICIFVTANIIVKSTNLEYIVVNCFQKFVSLWRRTSSYKECVQLLQLWIAFKNLYLCDGEHQYAESVEIAGSCELLSKICIFVTANILSFDMSTELIVVNCFQKFVSLWRRTSLDISRQFLLQLWIAFKNLYLCDGEHHIPILPSKICGCELLSKICIFVTANITRRHFQMQPYVVNCFQKFVSLWRRTSFT